MSLPKQGDWISFYADLGSVELCCPVNGKARVCGQVIGIKPLTRTDKIPSAALTVRGRSGRTATIDMVEHYVTEHASQAEAVNACKPASPPDLRGAKYIMSVKGGTLWRLPNGDSWVSNTLTEADEASLNPAPAWKPYSPRKR